MRGVWGVDCLTGDLGEGRGESDGERDAGSRHREVFLGEGRGEEGRGLFRGQRKRWDVCPVMP